MQVVRSSLFAVGGAILLLIVSQLLPESAQAQGQTQPPSGDVGAYETEPISIIDCFTQSVPQDLRPIMPSHADGQRCALCHEGSSPVAGRGDRPKTRYGTVVIANLTHQAMDYDIQVARRDGPETWVKHTLPGRSKRSHYWGFVRPGENRAAKYFMKFNGDLARKVRKLHLAASPRNTIGSTYYFDRDTDGETYLYRPGGSGTSRGRFRVF